MGPLASVDSGQELSVNLIYQTGELTARRLPLLHSDAKQDLGEVGDREAALKIAYLGQ
jgi:hypothetical protein